MNTKNSGGEKYRTQKQKLLEEIENEQDRLKKILTRRQLRSIFAASSTTRMLDYLPWSMAWLRLVRRHRGSALRMKRLLRLIWQHERLLAKGP